jgi:hypothetical protein
MEDKLLTGLRHVILALNAKFCGQRAVNPEKPCKS